jgi:hypothetical protein
LAKRREDQLRHKYQVEHEAKQRYPPSTLHFSFLFSPVTRTLGPLKTYGEQLWKQDEESRVAQVKPAETN